MGVDGCHLGIVANACTPPLQATEQRIKKQQLMPAGPQRVGGSGSGVDWRSLDPGQAAALAAVRRAADAAWCGGHHDEVVVAGYGIGEHAAPAAPSEHDYDNDDVVVVRVVHGREWTCKTCTFLNRCPSDSIPQCEMCGTAQ